MQTIEDVANTPALLAGIETLNHMVALEQQELKGIQAIANQLGYSGTLTVGAIEDEIRFYQRRTVEDCLELGKRLVMLKEILPHGDFTPRAEMLGFSVRTAQKFMSATLKFSNAKSISLLGAMKSPTKLLELLVLDDSEIEELGDGKTVRGLALDAIEKMSVSELKKALRTSKSDLEATQSVIERKDARINELDLALEKSKNPFNSNIEMTGEHELHAIQETTRKLTTLISANLNSEITKLFLAFNDMPPEHMRLAAAQSIAMVLSATYGVADNMNLNPITNPASAAEEPGRQDAQEFMSWANTKNDTEELVQLSRSVPINKIQQEIGIPQKEVGSS